MSVVALLFLGGFGLLLAWRAYTVKRERVQMTQVLADMKSVQTTLLMARLDAGTAGDDAVPLPADIGAKTTREYLLRFVKGGYWSEKEVNDMLERSHIAVVNVSKSDPPDTAFLVSFDAPPGCVVFLQNGSGGVFKREQDIRALNLPKREPQILP